MNHFCRLKKVATYLSVALMFSCTASYQSSPFPLQKSQVFTRGLGEFRQFSDQQEGESYTTQAPQNQIYLFGFASNELDSKYVLSIKAQAAYLLSHPKAHILLAGHTDERGSREYNIALGERRAQSVAEWFKQSGVNMRQIQVVSYGKERPAAFGHDESAYNINRRTELTYENKL